MESPLLAEIGARYRIRLLLQHGSTVAGRTHADPLFLKKILERCRLLFGSPRHLAELRIYAFRRYQDHRRFLVLEQAYVSRSLQRMAAR